MDGYLINPGRMHTGKLSDDAKFRQLRAMIEALEKRVEQLEAKRGPGRPRNEDRADIDKAARDAARPRA
jgi:hypothetical protein